MHSPCQTDPGLRSGARIAPETLGEKARSRGGEITSSPGRAFGYPIPRIIIPDHSRGIEGKTVAQSQPNQCPAGKRGRERRMRWSWLREEGFGFTLLLALIIGNA